MTIQQGESVEFPRHRVSVRANWTDPWVPAATAYGADIFCEQAVQVAAPTIPAASFTWNYGMIKWEDQTGFRSFGPVFLNNLFVKVERIIGQTLLLPVVRLLWVGVFSAEADRIGGEDVRDALGRNYPTGDQDLAAFGLEYLLDRVTIHSAWITNDNAKQVEINTVPVFNEQYVRGLSPIGNRSATKVAHFDANQVALGNSYCFGPPASTSSQRSDPPPWSVHDILDYLVLHYRPRGVTFELAGAVDELKNVVLPRISLEGLTVRDALNMLVGRKRGLGWMLRYAQEGDGTNAPSDTVTVQVYVFSLIETDVTVIGTSQAPFVALRANDRQLDFDLRSLDVQEAIYVNSVSTKYGKVRVLGERVRSMFTLSYADGTLTKAWSEAEQTSYISPGGADAEAKDANRGTDALRQVWTTFQIPEGWDWQVGNGAGGSKNTASIRVRDNGTIDLGGGGVEPALRKWPSARTFTDQLPIRKTRGLGTTIPEFLEPIALVKDQASGLYMHAEQHSSEDLPSGQLRMLDSMAGVELRFNPSHLLSKGHYSPTIGTDSNHAPAFDFDECVFTVCAELDERHKFVVTIDADNPDPELVIEVPDAHLWYTVPGTVIGVSGGALVRQATAKRERDDGDRLATVAELAKVWYGRLRTTVTLYVKDLLIAEDTDSQTNDLRPGNFLRYLLSHAITYNVNTVITERVWNFRDGSTEIHTHYSELDFVER